ncbi:MULTISPECIES: hypothetical protein [Rhizobium]|uniref:hypothetical protein n=1 Tax=Rhizobium TaxID=379 RepID=UPI00041B8979|nr:MULTISPECIES: hypothetical protein [Rhizobium]UFS81551.1 hypothetical protein LPB79_25095 [Rhizobium sp. T136]
MDTTYFQDWSSTELRAERRAIECQLLIGAQQVSYAGGGSANLLNLTDAKALIRLISNRIAEIEGRPVKRPGLRFITLISGE